MKSSSTPSTPLRTEGPAPAREANSTPTPRDNPGKGKGKQDPDQAGKIAANKKGQQCTRFYRGNCARGESCQYGHILGTDGKPLKIAPELLACFDGSTRPRKGKERALMRLLNAIERADSRCYCLLDTGANALVLPKREGMTGCEPVKLSVRCQVAMWSLAWWCKWWPVTVMSAMRWQSKAPRLFFHCRGHSFWQGGNTSRKWIKAR